MITGGTDAGTSAAMFAALAKMGQLSERNDDSARASRPFARDRDGFFVGEGSVAQSTAQPIMLTAGRADLGPSVP